MYLLKVLTSSEYTCGTTGLTFSGTFPYIVSTIVLAIKIAVPIALIIFGLIDLLKSVAASKEDEIKKGQQLFFKRAITALIVFFVIQIVQILLRFVSGSDANVVNCFNCFINGTASDTSCVAL